MRNTEWVAESRIYFEHYNDGSRLQIYGLTRGLTTSHGLNFEAIADDDTGGFGAQ